MISSQELVEAERRSRGLPLTRFGQYLKAIWDVINFEEAAKRFEAAQ